MIEFTSYMKKYFLKLLIGIVLFSCKDIDKPLIDNYLGYYQRIDDEASGDVILVKLNEDRKLIAVFDKVSDFSAKFGYKIGDVKFTFVKVINGNTIEIANLGSFMRLNSETNKVISIEKKYLPFLVSISSNNIIEFYEKPNKSNKKESYGPIDVGTKQKWKKLKK